MIQLLLKNWLLLVMSAVFDATVSAVYFGHAERGFHAVSSVIFLGELTLAGGAFMIAAGVWSAANGKRWLLVLNGLASSALGLLLALWRGPLSLRTVALLVVAMAISIGIYEVAAARTLRRSAAGEWFLGAAGAASLAFAVAFLLLAFGWIKLDPASPAMSLNWFGSFFAFCAICVAALALLRNGTARQSVPQP